DPLPLGLTRRIRARLLAESPARSRSSIQSPGPRSRTMPEEAAKKNVVEKAGLFAGRAMEAVTPALPNFATYGSGKVADAAGWCAAHGNITLRVTKSAETGLAQCAI